jgi:hypothetical protein
MHNNDQTRAYCFALLDKAIDTYARTIVNKLTVKEDEIMTVA